MTGKRDTPLLNMLRQLAAGWLKRAPVSRRGRLDAEGLGPDSLPLPDYAAALTEFWRGAPQLNANRIWASVEAGFETMPQVAGRASQQAQVSPSARLRFLSSQPRTWGLAATVAGLAAIGVTAAVLLTPGESTTSSFVTEIEQPRFVEAPGDRPSRAESTGPSFVTQVEQLFLLTETALVDGELSAAETAAIRDHTAEIAASAEDAETRLETLSVEELASIAATLLAVEVRLKAYGSEGGGAVARSLASLRTASHAVQEAITISADTSDS